MHTFVNLIVLEFTLNICQKIPIKLDWKTFHVSAYQLANKLCQDNRLNTAKTLNDPQQLIKPLMTCQHLP